MEMICEFYYYPFGMEMDGEWSQTNTSPANQYKFNGNELQSDFGLNVYDFNLRTYDPAIGRFWQVDPLASHPNQIDKSPYAYGWNNPIRFNDPNGDCPDCLFDIGFIIYDIASIAYGYATTGEVDPIDVAALSADVGALVVPGVTGAGLFTRLGKKGAKQIDEALQHGDEFAEGVDDAVDLDLNYKDTWNDTQRKFADEKADAISNDPNTRVVHNPERKSGLRGRFKRAGGDIDKSQDVDHTIELQLGGADDLSNTKGLDKSVNRSFGSQIRQQIKDLPEGTKIGNVRINDKN